MALCIASGMLPVKGAKMYISIEIEETHEEIVWIEGHATKVTVRENMTTGRGPSCPSAGGIY